MKCKTRKLVFTALAVILISLLFTCVPYGSEHEDYPDEYLPDAGSVTIYLDDSAPVSYSRSLNLSLAIFGHDLFEVSFYHPGSGVIARAVWEKGHAAGVSGVYRGVNGAGVDYRYATVPAANTNGDGVAVPGAAILFVGKKSDRTLLAVGRLTHVNGEPGAIVKADSRTVTFSVAALRAGVSATGANKGSSSFKTDALAPGLPGENDYTGILQNGNTTDLITTSIGIDPFPLFRLAGTNSGGRWVHGEYTFNVVTNDIETYRGAILQKSNIELVFAGTVGPTNYERVPRYPIGDNKWVTHEDTLVQELVLDRGVGQTNVQATVNAAANTPFNNPVRFKIGPTVSVATGTPGRVFVFSFQIPVYPLIDGDDNRAAGFSWYLRPGYDSYLYDLDDGMGGSGGAILLGTGTFEEAASYSLTVRKPPDKTKYNGTGANPYDLDLTGIEVYLRTAGGTIDVSDASTLYYVVGTGNSRIAINLLSGSIQTILSNPLYNTDGVVKVTLEYYRPLSLGGTEGTQGPPYSSSTGARNLAYDGDDPYYGEITLYYFPIPPGFDLTIPTQNRRFIITNDEDWRNRLGNSTGWLNPTLADHTYLLVFFQSFNIGDVLNLTGNTPRNIIFLAGSPDVIIGKTTTTTNAFNDNGAGNMYYFGVWPFDVILSAEGLAFESYPFIVNTAGPYQDVTFNAAGVPNPTTTSPTGYFISRNATPVIDNRNVQNMGVTFVNPRITAP